MTDRRFLDASVALVRPLAAQGTANYTYTVIADASNCFNLGSPALNNRGEAAFVGNCGAPIGSPSGGVVVRRGDGSGSLADIYTVASGSIFSVPETAISINDEGAVAFPGSAGSTPRDPRWQRWRFGEPGRR